MPKVTYADIAGLDSGGGQDRVCRSVAEPIGTDGGLDSTLSLFQGIM